MAGIEATLGAFTLLKDECEKRIAAAERGVQWDMSAEHLLTQKWETFTRELRLFSQGLNR